MNMYEALCETMRSVDKDFHKKVDDAYKRGLDDAWECARKLCQSERYGGLEEYCAEIFNRQGMFDVFDYSAEEAIAKIKEYEEKHSVNPQEKTGHWIYICNSAVNGLKIVKCSECGKRTYGRGNYCPNCGSAMKKERLNLGWSIEDAVNRPVRQRTRGYRPSAKMVEPQESEVNNEKEN